MNPETLADAHQRRRALDPQTSFIVQAPAGSGKTTLLIQRYLTLLATVEQPEEILAITFTRKAANQMKDRIIQALTQTGPNTQDKTALLAQAAYQQNIQRRWQLIENPHRFKIMTIDAFCADLVRKMPLSARSGTPPNINEYPEADYEKAAHALIHSVDEHSPTAMALRKVIQHLDNDLLRTQRLMVNLLHKRDQWLPHIATEHPCLDHLRQQLEGGIQQLLSEKITCCQAALPKQLEKDLTALTHFARQQGYTDAPQMHEPLTEHRQWIAMADFLLTQSHQWRRNPTHTMGFPPEKNGTTAEEKALFKSMKAHMKQVLQELSEYPDFKDALQGIRLCPHPKYEEQQWAVLCALLDILPVLVAHLSLIFQENNHSDFIEIALAAAHALGAHHAPSDLALSLDYHIQHILVDEFQDTSSTQYQLLERLIEGWQDRDGHTLFLVGDPMQSIYRFRDADVNLLIKTSAYGIANIQPEHLVLRTNFRSSAVLIPWVNQVCQNLFPKSHDANAGAVAFSPSCAAPNTHIRDTEIGCFAYTHKTQEHHKIVRLIQNHPQKTIAILVRSRTQLHGLLTVLKEANIAYQGVDLESLEDHSAVTDLFNLTKALFDPMNRTAWLALLRAPWCGLLLADLHEIAQQTPLDAPIMTTLNNPITTHLSSDGIKRIARVTPILRQALSNRFKQPTCHWIQGCWHALGGPIGHNQTHDMATVQSYFNLLLQLEKKHPIRQIETIQNRLSGLYAQPQASVDNPVQIMTIHRSKGLEFDIIILPSLESRSRSNLNPLLLWEQPLHQGQHQLLMSPINALHTTQSDPIYDCLKDRAQKKDHHEQMRLLYVAMTRARQSLYCLATIEPKGKGHTVPPAGSLLHHLWPTLSAMFLSGMPQDNPKTEAPQKHISMQRLPCDFQHPIACTTPIEHTKADAALIYPSTRNQHIGIALHFCLEQLSHKASSDHHRVMDRLLNACARYFSRVGMEENQKQILSCIENALNNTLKDPRGLWILDPTHAESHSEYALTVHDKGHTKHLIIDRTFIDKNNTRWIIDYKTTPLESAQDPHDFLAMQAKQHQEQLSLYSRAMRSMEHRTIKTALYFPIDSLWIEVHDVDSGLFKG